MPIFRWKNVHSHENNLLSYIFFFNFAWNTPYWQAPIWSYKTPILLNLNYIMGDKSPWDAFFSNLLRKIIAPMPSISQKDVHSLKNQIALVPEFCRKNVQSFRNIVLSCHVFSILNEKPRCCHAHIIFEQKTSILSKVHYTMDQKS